MSIVWFKLLRVSAQPYVPKTWKLYRLAVVPIEGQRRNEIDGIRE
jgi:hypothetical protein